MNTVFKALNDPTRRAILEMLRERDLTAGEIAEAFDISKPSISHHLDLLLRAELVDRQREGQFLRYRLNTTVLEDAMQWLLALLQEPQPRTDHDAA
ncbi:MAG: sporulation delaying system autorepressor SdpR [Rhodothermales bacterium]